MPQRATPTRQAPEPVAPVVAAPAAAPVTTQERDDFVTHLIGRHGTERAALLQIAGEQLKFKRRAQHAEGLVKDLQKQVPAADAVVLSGDEAKAYQTLKGKGITLDKVPAQLEELSGLQTSVKTGTRAANLKDAAGKKYDLSVLTRLLGDTPLEFQNVNQMKEDKSGIETVKVPFVVLKVDGKDTREALDTYVEREFAAFKEILGAKDGTDEESSSNSSTETKDEPKMPRQAPSSGSSTPKGKDADMLKAVDKATSGFMTPSQRRKEAAGAK